MLLIITCLSLMMNRATSLVVWPLLVHWNLPGSLQNSIYESPGYTTSYGGCDKEQGGMFLAL